MVFGWIAGGATLEAARATREATEDKSTAEAPSLCKHLDTQRYRGSFLGSTWVLIKTVVPYAALWVAAALYWPTSGLAIRAAMLGAWGGVIVRTYMIFHDCGHGSFYQGFQGAKTLNWLTLHFSSVLCATPTDWNVGHQLHHANVGNIAQHDYDWGETIFHQASEYVKLPKWKQNLWKVLRHPLPFFLLAPALTWYVKMRLPFELRPDRKAAYRFTDKMLNLAWYLLRCKVAANYGFLGLVIGGDYLGMLVGVLLFHWQHVYEPGYVKGADWSIKDASMHGSSLLIVPEVFKFFTLGIEYHHIHHFRTRIPGYMLRKCHEEAPAGTWKEIVTMRGADCWRSLFLQVCTRHARTLNRPLTRRVR
jgi:omega-6 fatty acid desaturase (delta-12 desaturase)